MKRREKLSEAELEQKSSSICIENSIKRIGTMNDIKKQICYGNEWFTMPDNVSEIRNRIENDINKFISADTEHLKKLIKEERKSPV